MSSYKKLIRRYSQAFKSQVVQDIENGRLTQTEAAKVYDIAGHSTIKKWLTQFGTERAKNRIIRIETPNEVGSLVTLKNDKQQLESALAKAQLKILALETILEKAGEHYGNDLKKNFGMKV